MYQIFDAQKLSVKYLTRKNCVSNIWCIKNVYEIFDTQRNTYFIFVYQLFDTQWFDTQKNTYFILLYGWTTEVINELAKVCIDGLLHVLQVNICLGP